MKLHHDDKGDYIIGRDGRKAYVDIPALVDAVRKYSIAQRELDKFAEVLDVLKEMGLDE